MWLDRFSGHSTPSESPPPQNRPYSPAPRRPNGLVPTGTARPPFGPRISSLNLDPRANLSTSSVNSQTPPADLTDPLEALEAIVGRSIPADRARDGVFHDESSRARPRELVEAVDFGGLSLDDFARSCMHDPDAVSAKIGIGMQTLEQSEYVASFQSLSCLFDSL